MLRERGILVDEPAQDEIMAHESLINWANWCRIRGRSARCFSIEGRYLAPAGNVFETREPKTFVDVLAAEMVNVSLVVIPCQHRDALHSRYFLRLADRLICRRLGLRVGSYQRFLRDARLMLWSVLLINEIKHRLPVDNSNPPSNEALWQGAIYGPKT